MVCKIAGSQPPPDSENEQPQSREPFAHTTHDETAEAHDGVDRCTDRVADRTTAAQLVGARLFTLTFASRLMRSNSRTALGKSTWVAGCSATGTSRS